jgi:hypothetical protein
MHWLRVTGDQPHKALPMTIRTHACVSPNGRYIVACMHELLLLRDVNPYLSYLTSE